MNSSCSYPIGNDGIGEECCTASRAYVGPAAALIECARDMAKMSLNQSKCDVITTEERVAKAARNKACDVPPVGLECARRHFGADWGIPCNLRSGLVAKGGATRQNDAAY